MIIQFPQRKAKGLHVVLVHVQDRLSELFAGLVCIFEAVQKKRFVRQFDVVKLVLVRFRRPPAINPSLENGLAGLHRCIDALDQ